MRGLRFIGGLLIAACLAGCSSVRPWINAPLAVDNPRPSRRSPPSGRDPSIMVAVTLSGGGARAAAFGYGVLTELHRTSFQWNGRNTDLLDNGRRHQRRVGRQHPGGVLRGLRRREDCRISSATSCGRTSRTASSPQTLRPGTPVQDLTSPWYGRSNVLAAPAGRALRGARPSRTSRDNPPRTATHHRGDRHVAGHHLRVHAGAVRADLLRPAQRAAVLRGRGIVRGADRAEPDGAEELCGRVPRAGRPRAGGLRRRHRLPRAHVPRRRPRAISMRSGVPTSTWSTADWRTTSACAGCSTAHSPEAACAGASPRSACRPAASGSWCWSPSTPSGTPPTTSMPDDQVPSLAQVGDALLFGTGARATIETQEFLARHHAPVARRTCKIAHARTAPMPSRRMRRSTWWRSTCATRRRRNAPRAASDADGVLDQRRGSHASDRSGARRPAALSRVPGAAQFIERPGGLSSVAGADGRLGHGGDRLGHRLGAARPHPGNELVGVLAHGRMAARRVPRWR